MLRLRDFAYFDPLPFFFFNDTATTEIYTLSLHDALPIFAGNIKEYGVNAIERYGPFELAGEPAIMERSEEHTSEIQSRQYLVCRLLLEKKKINTSNCKLPAASIDFIVLTPTTNPPTGAKL